MIKNYYRVLLALIGSLKNWPSVIAAKIFNQEIQYLELKNGLRIFIGGKLRPADLSMFAEIFYNKFYNPAGYEIGKNDLVIDIGANNGYFTVFAAKEAPEGRIISFEPVPELAKKIDKNIATNNLKNVKLENIAVSDNIGLSTFYVSQVHNGCHSLFHRNDSDEKIEVATTTLEAYCSENKIAKIDFLKLDCEGAEYKIFQSLSEAFLRKSIKKISMEYHDDITDNMHTLIEQILLNAEYDVSVKNGFLYAENRNL